MSSDPVSKTLLLHRCVEVDCDKTAVRGGFLSYSFPTGEIYGLTEEETQAKKRERGVDEVTTTEMPAAVSVTFRAVVLRVHLASYRQYYNA